MIKTSYQGIYYRINKDGSKTYYLRLTHQHKQTWRAVGRRITDAKELRNKIKVERAEGRLDVMRPQKHKFRELAEEYWGYYTTKAKPRNWARIQSIIKQLNSFFRNIEVSKVSSWTIKNYKLKRKQEGLAPKSINNELDTLRSMLNRAIEWKWIKTAPKINRLPIQKKRERVLSDDEIELAVSSPFISDDHRDAIYIGLDTGMRLIEIFLITPESIDFDNDLIHLDDTKSLKPRSIPMTDRAKGIFERRFKENKGKLFLDRTASRLSSKFCLERKDLVKYEGMLPWVFHDLRHTWATNLLERGVEIYTVMELGGWSRLEMVARYLHTSMDKKREAIKKLNHKIQLTKKRIKDNIESHTTS